MKKLLIVVIVILLSCRNNKVNKEITDPEKFASMYCDCMRKNNGKKEFIYAATVCDGEFIQKNHLFRLLKTDLKYYETEKIIRDSKIRDSAFKFGGIIDSLTSRNCCEVAANCRGATK